jgi:FkbM family methyltransferase
MNLSTVAENTPDPITRIGGAAYIWTKRILGQNQHRYEYDGSEFIFEYSTTQQFGKSRGLVTDDGIGPEGVPMELLNVDAHDAIIDVGAHFGLYSVIFGMLSPDIKLFSFEPNNYNRSVLERNLRINGIDATISEKIVSDETGTIPFYEDRDIEGSVRDTTVPDNEECFTRVERPSIALSDLFDQEYITRPFVKIDAEGAEQDILIDLFEQSKLNHLAGIVELHNERLDDGPKALLDYLAGQGMEYDCVKKEPVTRKAYHFYPA